MNHIPTQNLVNNPAKKTNFTTTKLFRTSLLYQTKEFFNNSTLHGIRYIAETERPFGERFMWFCFTATGAVAALIIIFSLWEKFQTNPTITGLDTDFHNHHVTFPTTIVCPDEPANPNKTRDLAFEYFGDYDENIAGLVEPFLLHFPQISVGSLNDYYEKAKKILADPTLVKKMNKKTLRSYIFQIAVSCDELFDWCKYRDEDINCCDYFYPVLSEQGFCYAFNAKYFDTADTEEIRTKFSSLFETDRKWSLLFKPKLLGRFAVLAHNELYGFDIKIDVEYGLEYTSELLIAMKQTYTTDDARQLSVGQRKCIFPDEVVLDYYRDEYTFTGCMKECRIKKCIKLCHCLPPFYRPSDKIPYCRINQLDCLAKYARNITDVRDCSHCELCCKNTVYDSEKLSKTSTTSPEQPTVVNVEFLTWPIIRYKREVLFGWVDLLVSFGGIAGLFLGFSLLSGVEIVYYFTMRACCMLYKNRVNFQDELKQIEEEKLKNTQKSFNLNLKVNLKDNENGKGASGLITPSNIILVGGNKQQATLTNKSIRIGSEQHKIPKRIQYKLDARKRLIQPKFQQTKISPISYIGQEYGYIP